jgi:hypothetical protein
MNIDDLIESIIVGIVVLVMLALLLIVDKFVNIFLLFG